MKLLLAVITSCVLALTLGCAGGSARSSTQASSRVPEDFALSVTVSGPVRAGGSAAYAQLPAALRPVRYVLEPDHVLRAAIGPGAQETEFPPRTRRLDPAQGAEIWTIVRSSGVLNQDHPDSASRAPTFDLASGTTAYVVSARASGRRSMVAMVADPEPSPSAAGVVPLLERLSTLAWLPDRPSADAADRSTRD